MIYFLYMGVLLSALLFFVRARRAHMEFPVKATWDMTFALMVGGFVGARLAHVAYEDWHFYRGHLENIFYFWLGGFVYYGGVFGAVLASFLFIRFYPHALRKTGFWKEWSAWANFFTPAVSLGYAFGRIGCQISGCCFGKTCDLPWAMDGRHPTALYLSASEFLIFFFLTQLDRLKLTGLKNHLFLTWLVLNSFARFLIEPLRADFRGAAIMGWSLSSWVSLVTVVTGSAFLAFRRAHKT